MLTAFLAVLARRAILENTATTVKVSKAIAVYRHDLTFT